MGGSVKEYGGGAATGLANDFIKFMSQGINGTGFAGSGPQQTANVDPSRQTNGFADAIANLLGGGGLKNPGYRVDTSKLSAQGSTGFNFNPTDFSQFVNPTGVDFSQFNPNITGRINPLDLSKFTLGTGGLDINSITRTGNMGGLPTAPGVNINAGTATGLDPNSPHFKAVADLIARKQAHDIAQQRAIFGQGGGAGLGTGAAYATSELLSRQPSELANTLGNLDLAYRSQNLGERGLDVQAQTAQAQLKKGIFDTLVSAAIQGDQNAIQLLQTHGSNLNALLSAMVTGRGQDINALISEGGLNLDALKAGAGQNIDLKNIGLNALKAQSGENVARSGLELQNKGLNIDALSKALGIDLGGQELNLKSMIAGGGLQSDIVRALLASYGDLAGKGIIQRQLLQKPSFLQNLTGAVTGIAGAVAPFATGGFNFGRVNNPVAVNNVAPAEIGTIGSQDWWNRMYQGGLRYA